MIPIELVLNQVARLRSCAALIASSLLFAPHTIAARPIDPLTLQGAAHCQPSWIPTFGGQPGVDGEIKAATVFNDGSGPALYVCGEFTYAGGVLAPRIAKWDGSNWSALAGGTFASAPGSGSPTLNAFTVFDDGGGDALYVGGQFTTAGGVVVNGIAKWTGSSWSALGSGMVGGPIYALAAFDDGQGLQLYAGGAFHTAGGIAAYRAAKWNGTSWSPSVGMGGSVYSLSVLDDGNGSALYAGTASGVAKLYGTIWSSLGGGMNDRVTSVSAFNDVSGPAICAGGQFTIAGGATVNRVAKWDGSSWSAMAGGMNGSVKALVEFNDGTGRALYAGGQFTTAGGQPASCMAKWNGSTWSALGTGASSGSTVNALTTFNGGSGRQLYACGSFGQMGGAAANSIAKWNGSTWSNVGRVGLNNNVSTLTQFDHGSGPALYAGGWFTNAGGVATSHIAKWDGVSWSALGAGIDGPSALVVALAVFDDGSGPALYAGGRFTTAGGLAADDIARWDGSSWSALGSGISGTPSPGVYSLTVFDDGTGPALYAGGYFAAAGGIAVNNIAKWDGSTWSAVGAGTSGSVFALVTYDDGTGPALCAAGAFITAGGLPAKNIAKWNGSNWSGLANAMTSNYFNPVVESLAVFDDGSGAALYVGGIFSGIDGVMASHIAKWDGSAWSALGNGLVGPAPPSAVTQVQALAVFDDGSGPKLFAKGDFTSAGGVVAGGIASWDGLAWSPLGQGLNWDTLTYGGALAVFDDSSGPALFVGGGFRSSLDSGDSYLAKWGCSFVSSGATYCTPGTTSGGCLPAISASGSASATTGSGFTISISNLESHRLGVIFYGIHGQVAHPWGAGGTSSLCVKSPTQRLDPYDSGGSPGLCNGLISEDWNLFIANHPSALGHPFLGGETVWAQGWFRDPPSAKTTALSNGLVFAVAP